MVQIAAVQGGSSRLIQSLMMTCARRWAAEGLRVVGAVEVVDPGRTRACEAVRLQTLRSGETYRVFQDLSRFSRTC